VIHCISLNPTFSFALFLENPSSRLTSSLVSVSSSRNKIYTSVYTSKRNDLQTQFNVPNVKTFIKSFTKVFYSTNMEKYAISGKIASGKTSLALEMKDFLSKTYKTKVFSFSSPIKKIAYECFSMSTDPNLKDRKLLQDIGQFLKQIDKNVWVKAFLNEVNKIEKTVDYIICDDLRFKNEAISLKNDGFKLIRLNINEESQIERLKKTYPKTWKQHSDKSKNISEIDLDEYKDFDLIVNIITDCPESKVEPISVLRRKVFNAIENKKQVIEHFTN
jgi:cytidylate kinase